MKTSTVVSISRSNGYHPRLGLLRVEIRSAWCGAEGLVRVRLPAILLMDKILHDPKDPKLWELWYIPYNG